MSRKPANPKKPAPFGDPRQQDVDGAVEVARRLAAVAAARGQVLPRAPASLGDVREAVNRVYCIVRQLDERSPWAPLPGGGAAAVDVLRGNSGHIFDVADGPPRTIADAYAARLSEACAAAADAVYRARRLRGRLCDWLRDRLRDLVGAPDVCGCPGFDCDRGRFVHLVERARACGWECVRDEWTAAVTLCERLYERLQLELEREGEEATDRSGPVAAPPRAELEVVVDRVSRRVCVGDNEKQITPGMYNVLVACIEAGPAGLHKDDLVRKSGQPDAPRLFRQLAALDDELSVVVRRPGKSWRGYRVRGRFGS